MVDRLNGAEKIYTTIESQHGMCCIGKYYAAFAELNLCYACRSNTEFNVAEHHFFSFSCSVFSF